MLIFLLNKVNQVSQLLVLYISALHDASLLCTLYWVKM